MTMNEEITAETVVRAMPQASQCRPDAQIPLLVYENDSLEAFIDRSFVSLYDQLMAQTGSHSKVARLLDTDRSALYRRLERTRRRLQSRSEDLLPDRNRSSALDA
jgi:hypothetical protein